MKYIFLDEFVWIDIRRSALKENGAKDLSKVIRLIEIKSNNGEWIFPISVEHLVETANTSDQVKRLTTAYIMDEISKGYTILEFSKLKDFEIGKMLDGQYAPDFRAEVIKKDIMNMWGHSTHELIDEVCQKNDMSISEDLQEIVQIILNESHSICRSMITPKYISDEEKKMYGEILDYLKKQDCKDPYVSEEQFLMYTLEQYYSEDQQYVILEYINKELGTYENPRGETLKKLFYRLPTYYTNCMLLYKNMKMQNVGQSASKNDFRDMLYLSYMIPYCDIVITEKKWTNIIQQMHLDKIFNTIVVSDVNQLLNIE